MVWRDSSKNVFVVSPIWQFTNALQNKLVFILYKEGRILTPYLGLGMNSLPNQFTHVDRDIVICRVTDK